MKNAHFVTDCVSSTGRLITPMNDTARDITRRTFLKAIDREELRAIESQLSYESHPRRGLTMAGDYHVSYYKSTYAGRPCVFFRHSLIEYIFQEEA